MSCNRKVGSAPPGGWLEGDQQREWLAYIRVHLRLVYEMNRQLLADSGMSLPDYDVLTALSVADGGRMQITVLAAQIGWERSRVSHHVRRMRARGLVTCDLSAADRRATEVTLTARGRQALEEAAPGHVDNNAQRTTLNLPFAAIPRPPPGRNCYAPRGWMTGYGPPEVLKWAGVPLLEPGEGQIRIKVKAAGVSPTDLALRAGYLKTIPLPRTRCSASRQQAPSTRLGPV
jgi:DNA-binding MarR family transcriptional regulator